VPTQAAFIRPSSTYAGSGVLLLAADPMLLLAAALCGKPALTHAARNALLWPGL